MYKALMIEDHKEVRDFVKEYFDHKEIEVIEAQNGYEGLAILDDTIDIILLDIMMPGIDGYEVCKQIRSQYNTLIVFISALSEDENQLKAYEYGADDYITKPFSLAVLRARVNAQLRRSVPVKQERIELNGFILDFTRMEFSKEGTIIDLSKTEQRLLRLLVENRGRTLPRELLLEKVWDGGEFVDENALSVAVRRLRGKLGNAPIRTVYGVGYTWEVSK